MVPQEVMPCYQGSNLPQLSCSQKGRLRSILSGIPTNGLNSVIQTFTGTKIVAFDAQPNKIFSKFGILNYLFLIKPLNETQLTP